MFQSTISFSNNVLHHEVSNGVSDWRKPSRMEGRGLDSSGLGQVPVVERCKQGNEY